MKLTQLIEGTIQHNIISKINFYDVDVSSVAYDSRKCTENCLFVAVKGEKADGKQFIPAAIEKGAKVVVCTDECNLSNLLQKEPNVTFIIVQDARKALAELSHSFYKHPSKKLKIIGITGTNGKTTITFLLKDILEQAKKKVAIIGTTGIYIGDRKIEATHTTPESLEIAELFHKMVETGIEYVLMEVSSHSLAMDRVYGIDFSVAAFTNLTQDHLDYHKTLEDYAAAKRRLFTSLSPDAIAVVNIDDKHGLFMLEGSVAQKVSLSENQQDTNYKVNDMAFDTAGSSFSLVFKGNTLQIHTKLSGRFNIQNAAIATVICLELGIEDNAIVVGLAKTRGAEGRLQRITLKNGAVAYIDYAHTPDALKNVLSTCKELIKNGRLICVFGCGGDRDKTKRPLMGEVAQHYADVVIVTDDNPRTEDANMIISQILSGMDKTDVKVIHQRDTAIKHAIEIAKYGDIVLIAGKGHENYQIIGEEKRHFSDLEVVSKFAE